MKITRIRVYQTPLPYCGGVYAWGAGNRIETAISNVVVIDTDSGLTGCGEFCPCGENYMEAHSQGVVGTISLLAPYLLGADPSQVAAIELLMDKAVRGPTVMQRRPSMPPAGTFWERSQINRSGISWEVN